MNMLHKLALASTLFATTMWGQVSPSAWIVSTGGAIFDGGGVAAPDTITIVLDGTADAGIARTENTLWLPDGSYQVLGDLGLGSHSYTPTAGPGLYWLQYRLVDNNEGYQDQWVPFTVQSGYLTPSAWVSPSGSNFILIQDGSASNGIGWTENVIWHPDGSAENLGNGMLGALTYTPSGGSGQYWYQFRLVDAQYNYRDQWIPFWAP